ncbi:MAG: signal peptide peptidase SppA [Calditrichia bacterium]
MVLTLLLCLSASDLLSQPIPDYYQRDNFLMAPAGVFQDGLVGFVNPANLRMIRHFESRFLWSTNGTEINTINDWGIFAGVHGLGFGAVRRHFGDLKVTDYRISTGFGSDGLAWGMGYSWASGDDNAFGRERLFTASTIIRPFKYVSVGLIGNFSLESNAKEGIASIGVRPLGTPRLTLFADGAMQRETQFSNAPWSAGAAVQLLSGINLVGRYFDDDAYTLGLTINLGRTGAGYQAHVDPDRDHVFDNYMVRVGGVQPSIFALADEIVMDPEGQLLLPGYIMGRTFFKETLAKLGIGFEPWRFFKYKSAFESYSRDDFSEPDREQRQAYVDDLYNMVRADVCESRKFTHTRFDSLINDEVIFLSEDAQKAGLIDAVGRWPYVKEILKKMYGSSLHGISSDELLDNILPYQKWGNKPKIAVVYGLGVCAMDKGIKARWLEKVFLRLAKNHSVKAVVFRVDSPGGDVMASDVVAEAVRKCSKKKPVIVSQGQVAGSGGYWISMYGNEIIAGPNTITGSIGVIGGWVYNKDLTEKLGMTSDYVKRGAHAEVGFGVTFPFTGIELPARNLTPDEFEKVKNIIMQYYGSFVKKVAQGRGMSVEKVEQLAQGHFYSGMEGVKIGLVDELGGLVTAIAVAQERARIAPGEKVDLVEIPDYKGLIDLDGILSPFETSIKRNQVYQYLQMASEHPGEPLPMLLPGTYPTAE